MNNHRSASQRSINTIRKWLLEAGDGPSTSVSPLNKISKRKRSSRQKYASKTTSLIDWFYEFIKQIFTVHDEDRHLQVLDDARVSIKTICSTCQFEHLHSHINARQSTLESNTINPKKMITTATSSSNLNISSPSILLHSSKSTQTRINTNEQQSSVHPLYCLPVQDRQILSSPSSSTVEPAVKEDIASFYTKNEQSKITPNRFLFSRSADPSAVPAITSNCMHDDPVSKVHCPSSSLHDTRICHFDQRSCLIECYRSPSANANAPEIVFAERTCELIKQAWLSDQST